MHGLYELKEMLCKELEEYGSKEMTAGSLEVVDKLAHAIKNIDRIIDNYEEKEGYSERGSSYRRGYSREDGMSNRDGSYRGGSYDGGSYARGRGRNARRDSMGRYSRDDGQEDMVQQLQDMMEQAPNQQIKKRIEQLVNELENA